MVLKLTRLTVLLVLPLLAQTACINPAQFSGKQQTGRYARFASGGSFIGSDPSVSPNGDLIAFSSPASGEGDIYLFDVHSGSIDILIDGPRYEGEPSWSPDGSKIAFVREGERNTGEIWVLDLATREETQLTHGPGYDSDPAWRPDGQSIFFTRSKPPPRHVLTSLMECRIPDLVVKEAVTGDFLSQPAFGSDPDVLYFVDRDMIASVQFASNQQSELGGGFAPTLSSAEELVYFIRRDQDYQFDVWRMSVSGSEISKVSHSGGVKFGLSYNQEKGTLVFVKSTGQDIGPVVELDPKTGREVKLFSIKEFGQKTERMTK